MLLAALRRRFSRFRHDPFEGAFPGMQRGRDQERDWHAVEKAYVFGAQLERLGGVGNAGATRRYSG